MIAEGTAPLLLTGRRASLAVLLVLTAGFAACRQLPTEIAAPLPQAADPADLHELERGRAIYVSSRKCARCHSPKPVYDFSPSAWREDILPRMARKARLSQAEYSDALAYVTSSTAQTRAARRELDSRTTR